MAFLKTLPFEVASRPANDKTGWDRGDRGVDRLPALLKGRDENAELLKPNFDRKRQLGEIYVGYYNQVTDNAQLEGDDA